MIFAFTTFRDRMRWLATTLVALPCLAFAQSSLTPLWNYTPVNAIQSMSVSQDGKWIAVGGFSGVQIYHQATHELAISIPSDVNGIVTSLAFSPNGSQLAIARFNDPISGGYAGALELRSVSTGKLIKQLPTTATFSVDSVAFSPDGRTLADGSRSYDPTTHTGSCALELWSTDSGYRRTTLGTSAAEIKSIVFSKVGSMLVDGGSGFTGVGTLELWNLKSSKLIETFPTIATQGVASVDISPDGKVIVDGGWTGAAIYSGVVEEWVVATGKLIAAPATVATQVNSVAISPDGRTFADGGPATAKSVLELWSLATGGQMASVGSNLAAVNEIAFTPDGKAVLDGGANGILELRSPKTLSLTSSALTSLYTNAGSIEFSPNGSVLAQATSESFGGTINLWNALTGKLGGPLISTSHRMSGVSISADNKTLADCGALLTSAGSVLELWDYAAQKLLGTLPTSASGLQSVQFSPDGKSVADGGTVSNTGLVELWDVKSKVLLRTFPTQASSVGSVAFSPNGSLLAVGGTLESSATLTYTGVVELWSVSTGKLVSSFGTDVDFVSRVAFSPDGQLLGVAGRSETSTGSVYRAAVEIWNTAKGTLADEPEVTAGAHYAYSITFSSSSKAFYVGTDVDVEAFSVLKFAKLSTFGQSGAIDIAVSPRGNLLAINSVIQWLGMFRIPI